MASEEQRASIDAVRNALDITASDTLGRISMDRRVIWTATNSWLRDQAVTIGDLRNLLDALEARHG